MSADREHEAKMRAMEAVMSGELRDVTRIGPPLPKVRYEPCAVCKGDGYLELYMNADGVGVIRECAYCAGRGTITVEVTE